MSAISIATCSRCKNQAVLYQRYSGVHLCHRHLADSIRRRVSKSLRAQLKLPKNALRDDGNPRVILVCISGGKDSAVLLDMMVRFLGPRRDIELVAGSVDEGIDGYRAPSLEKAMELASSYGIRVETISYPELEFERMDEIVKMMPDLSTAHKDADGLKPCSYCGVFRRQGLNALTGRIPSEMGTLTNLEMLYLGEHPYLIVLMLHGMSQLLI